MASPSIVVSVTILLMLIIGVAHSKPCSGLGDNINLPSCGGSHNYGNNDKSNTICNLLQILLNCDKRNNKNTCKYNREYINKYELGSCYKFHPTGVSWVEAKAICEMEGAELAMVNSQEEADYLKELFKAHQTEIEHAEYSSVVRLGLRLISKTWRYPDGTNIVDSGYNCWAPGEPNQPKLNHCGGIFLNGLLDDIGCTNNIAFICESNI